MTQRRKNGAKYKPCKSTSPEYKLCINLAYQSTTGDKVTCSPKNLEMEPVRESSEIEPDESGEEVVVTGVVKTTKPHPNDHYDARDDSWRKCIHVFWLTHMWYQAGWRRS